MHLVVIAIKERQETSLCPSGAFDATEPDVIPSAFEISQIP